MTKPNRCPQCGSPLPLDAPPGICPRCVLALGFQRPPMRQEFQVQSSNFKVDEGNPSPPNIEPGTLDSELPVLPEPPLPATSPATPSGRFVPPKPQELVPLFPQLAILDFVGSGGMGAVYKARQTKLDRLVALKILPPEVGQDPAFAERFAREARTLGRLAHPGIVGIYDFGQAGNLYYLLMEYVDGSNLRQVIETGTLKPEQALAIVPQVCEALQYAHDEGVVHRDIKPENILLDKKGRAKIADFGLAKLLSRPAGSFTLTDTQQVMGTPHYMAPEQLTSTHAVDHRADIYSLGVVFYEMLTGELPLGRFDPPSKRASVDARLDDVVLRTLERTPERRYQQASHVKTDVELIFRVAAPPIAAVAEQPGPPQTFPAASEQLGTDGWPVQPVMPPATPVAKRSRGTIGRAWDTWWGERDRWFTNLVQAILAIVAVGCLLMYLNFHGSSQATPNIGRPRSTLVLPIHGSTANPGPSRMCRSAGRSSTSPGARW